MKKNIFKKKSFMVVFLCAPMLYHTTTTAMKPKPSPPSLDCPQAPRDKEPETLSPRTLEIEDIILEEAAFVATELFLEQSIEDVLEKIVTFHPHITRLTLDFPLEIYDERLKELKHGIDLAKSSLDYKHEKLSSALLDIHEQICEQDITYDIPQWLHGAFAKKNYALSKDYFIEICQISFPGEFTTEIEILEKSFEAYELAKVRLELLLDQKQALSSELKKPSLRALLPLFTNFQNLQEISLLSWELNFRDPLFFMSVCKQLKKIIVDETCASQQGFFGNIEAYTSTMKDYHNRTIKVVYKAG